MSISPVLDSASSSCYSTTFKNYGPPPVVLEPDPPILDAFSSGLPTKFLITPPSPLPVELPRGLFSAEMLPPLFDAIAVFCENSIVSARSFLIFSTVS